MSYRLSTIFYVFALVASALATFGPAGVVLALIVLSFWAYCWKLGYPKTSIWNWIIAAFMLSMLSALLIPATPSAREAARRNQCMNNLKQIALAVLNYESANRVLPPAYLADANGKPIHSWRVLILPYLGEVVLFKKYNLNEPWDGPNNSKLAAQIPEVYRCPSHLDSKDGDSTETSYFAVVGPETVFPGSVRRAFTQIPDGTANTVIVIEASGLGVNWMEPRDVSIDEAIELLTTKPRSGHFHTRDGFLTTTYYETSERNVVFCDGHVLWMGPLSDAEIAKALLTAAGGESIPPDLRERFVEPRTTTAVKWGKVWGLSVFVVLSLLPAAWIKPRKDREQAVEAVNSLAVHDAV
jgi:prepilin-type processing-associated H-X9-DG protein